MFDTIKMNCKLTRFFDISEISFIAIEKITDLTSAKCLFRFCLVSWWVCVVVCVCFLTSAYLAL